MTPNSRFDQWLLGDDEAISERELEGYELFKQSGCIACHSGPGFGGTSFQKMGLREPYQTENPAEGVGGLTGVDADRFKFKLPTLRNVVPTYPYVHDSAAETMRQAVDLMGRLQLGKRFTQDETDKIVDFLETQTGDQPSFTLPILPPSTAGTPRPQPLEGQPPWVN